MFPKGNNGTQKVKDATKSTVSERLSSAVVVMCMCCFLTTAAWCTKMTRANVEHAWAQSFCRQRFDMSLFDLMLPQIIAPRSLLDTLPLFLHLLGNWRVRRSKIESRFHCPYGSNCCSYSVQYCNNKFLTRDHSPIDLYCTIRVAFDS